MTSVPNPANTFLESDGRADPLTEMGGAGGPDLKNTVFETVAWEPSAIVSAVPCTERKLPWIVTAAGASSSIPLCIGPVTSRRSTVVPVPETRTPTSTGASRVDSIRMPEMRLPRLPARPLRLPPPCCRSHWSYAAGLPRP